MHQFLLVILVILVSSINMLTNHESFKKIGFNFVKIISNAHIQLLYCSLKFLWGEISFILI